jgi:GST-like protein
LIELYTWPTPNGRKVSIALEELGLPYRVHPVDIGNGEQRDPDFLRISPNGKIPAIVDTSSGRHLMESGAILLYLAEREGRYLGEDRWETLEWLMLQVGGIGPMLGQVHHFTRFNPGVAPYAEARYGAEARRLYGVLDARLARREFLAGGYSIADMATWPWISRYQWQNIDLSEFPHVRRWYLNIAARPGVQRGYDVPWHVNSIPLPA